MIIGWSRIAVISGQSLEVLWDFKQGSDIAIINILKIFKFNLLDNYADVTENILFFS